MRRDGTRRGNTQEAIREAAVLMFSKYGYHAVTLRKMAGQIGIQAGSLYNHIANKEDLLFELLSGIMSDLIEGFEERVAGIEDPGDRLNLFIDNHVAFHTTRRAEVFIGIMELRNLSPENHARMIVLRDRYQACLAEIIHAGAARGLFRVRDERMCVFAIFGMLNGVATWFNPDGPLSTEEVSDHFRGFIWKMVRPD
jgi:AcrR family transcriptional regulator